MSEIQKPESEGSPFEFAKPLFADIEHITRYLLTGVMLVTAWLASLAFPNEWPKWGTEHPAFVAAITLAAGFGTYTLYRLAWWTIADRFFTWIGFTALTVPDREPVGFCKWRKVGATNKLSFAFLYADFLKWRHSTKMERSISSYLFYRWAVAHFSNLTGLAGFFALKFCEPDSLVARHGPAVWAIALGCLVMGIWQCVFLYLVELFLRSSLNSEGDQVHAVVDETPSSPPASGEISVAAASDPAIEQVV